MDGHSPTPRHRLCAAAANPVLVCEETAVRVARQGRTSSQQHWGGPGAFLQRKKTPCPSVSQRVDTSVAVVRMHKSIHTHTHTQTYTRTHKHTRTHALYLIDVQGTPHLTSMRRREVEKMVRTRVEREGALVRVGRMRGVLQHCELWRHEGHPGGRIRT